eukprot:5412540-Pyramimonas_sp.AAC.1
MPALRFLDTDYPSQQTPLNHEFCKRLVDVRWSQEAAFARTSVRCAPPESCGLDGVRRGSGGDLSIKSRRP